MNSEIGRQAADFNKNLGPTLLFERVLQHNVVSIFTGQSLHWWPLPLSTVQLQDQFEGQLSASL